MSMNENDEEQIISLLLDGYSYRDIKEKSNFGKNTTQKVVDDLKEKYGKNNIDDLIKISKSFKKANIPISHFFSCFRIYQVLQKLEFSGDEIYEFVNSIYLESTSRNVSPFDIVESAQKILSLDSDVAFEQIPEHYKELDEKSKQLKKDIIELNDSKTQSQKDTKLALEKSQMTLEKLDDFVTVRDALQKHSKATTDLSKLANMLEHCTEANYDVDKIIKHISNVNGFEDTCDALNKEIKSLQSQNDSFSNDISLQNKTISENKLILSNLEKFTTLGVSLKDIEELYIKVIEISHTHNTSNKESLKNLRHILATQYDDLMGLEKSLCAKKSDIAKTDDALLRSRDTLNDLISENNLHGIIPAITNLQKNNITIPQLISWQNILSANNLDVQTLQESLLEFTTLSNALNDLKLQCSDLKKTKNSISSQIDSLNSQKSDLIEFITQSKETGIKTINEIQDSANESITNVADSSKKEITATGTRTVSELSKSVKSFDTMINDVSEASQLLGKLTAIKPLYDIINGIDIKPINAYIGILGFLELFFAWQKNRGITAPVITGNTISLINGIKKEIDSLGK